MDHANAPLRFQVWRVHDNDRNDRALVAAFLTEIDAREYGDEFVAGDFTRYEVVEL